MSTRTPTTQPRFAAVPYTELIAVAVVAATATDPDLKVKTSEIAIIRTLLL